MATIKATNPVTGKTFDVSSSEFESTYKPLGWTTGTTGSITPAVTPAVTTPATPVSIAPKTTTTTTKKATLYGRGNAKEIVDVGSARASELQSQGWGLTAGSYKAPATSTATTPTIPEGAVAIPGAKYNTRELQQQNFTNIQPVGNTLYGIPKSPIVPDIIPQKDFDATMSSETAARVAEEAKGKVGFNEQQISDLNKAYERQVAGTSSAKDDELLAYAQGEGWQPTIKEEEKEVASPIGTPAPEKSTTDQIFEKMNSLSTARETAKAQAMEDTKLMVKGEAIATAQTLVNNLRTDLQNQGILDIKEQDTLRNKPILTSQIAGQLNELSREQKLDAMILQNNYNNALVEQQIAEGNYDRAREIVTEIADDAYDAAKEQIEALKYKASIEDKAAEKLDTELKYEREMAKDGYVLIRSTDALKGLTEDQIYRDPVSNKIYLKPKPEVATTMEIGGITYGFDSKGNKIANYGATNKNTTVPPPTDKAGTKSIDVNNVSGLKDYTGNFAKYNTVEESLAATEADITAKQTGNTRTGLNANSSLAQFNSVWTGETNPGYTGKDLAKYLNSNGYKNITENTNIGSIKAKDLTNAVAHFETGYNATGETKVTTGISKDDISKIENALVSQVGSDGYLNPADYNLAKQDWITLGGEPSAFDTKFKGRRNPKNNSYSLEGKASKSETTDTSNTEEITSLKDQGYTAEDLKTAGYDSTAVDNAYKTTGNFLTKAIDWLTFWK